MKLFRKKYKCCYCGKKLEPVEISMVGPGLFFWCEKSVCRGAGKFLQQSLKILDDKKMNYEHFPPCFCKDRNCINVICCFRNDCRLGCQLLDTLGEDLEQ